MTKFFIKFHSFVEVEFKSSGKIISFSVRHRLQDLAPVGIWLRGPGCYILCRESSLCLISGTATNNYYGCCETEFKARFCYKNKASNIEQRVTPPNSPKLSGRPRIA